MSNAFRFQPDRVPFSALRKELATSASSVTLTTACVLRFPIESRITNLLGGAYREVLDAGDVERSARMILILRPELFVLVLDMDGVISSSRLGVGFLLTIPSGVLLVLEAREGKYGN
ncbi:hypothetical protein CVT26_004356 [Gymnopilus dilepis]|uniref:Uncharacterized protein n=1 Tax=Gymnopilus dilepis TaxID=231916 RepID=A0A409WU56_9AGAR|nr:hypothetical protein CVT26_004356 [Gymnopilus dilepis]